VQPAQEEVGDIIRELFALAWEAGLKTWEPEWEKVSPGSLLIYKLSDKLAASPSMSQEARELMNLIKGGAFLYGLNKSDS
jgi:hypothetical protein